MVTEKELYEKTKMIFYEKFKKIGECYIEVTSRKIGDTIKRRLDDNFLFFLNAEKIFPDLTGYVIENGACNRIVVEIKNERIKIRDIYQTKMYGELFNSTYSYLISSEPLSEEMRRFLRLNPYIISYSAGYRKIKIAQVDIDKNDILEEDL